MSEVPLSFELAPLLRRQGLLDVTTTSGCVDGRNGSVPMDVTISRGCADGRDRKVGHEVSTAQAWRPF
jgi:hypothetical protein